MKLTFPGGIFTSAPQWWKCQVHDPRALCYPCARGPAGRRCSPLGREEELESTHELCNAASAWVLRDGVITGRLVTTKAADWSLLILLIAWNPGCCSSAVWTRANGMVAMAVETYLPAPEITAAAYLLFCSPTESKNNSFPGLSSSSIPSSCHGKGKPALHLWSNKTWEGDWSTSVAAKM